MVTDELVRMPKDELVKKLQSLVHLDIDAVHAYKEAIEKIDITSVKDELTTFRNDHERHIQVLSDLIRKFGFEPPEFSRDFKGFLIQGFTALRSVTGTEGALKAMQTNETLTNKNYDEALSWDVPEDVRVVLQRNRDDERRHLQYIDQAIHNRVWEKGRKVA